VLLRSALPHHPSAKGDAKRGQRQFRLQYRKPRDINPGYQTPAIRIDVH
jgi:hypothetical protein